MKHVLITERLLVREFVFDDKKFILELLNSPGWLQFIGDRNVKDETQAINYLENGPMKSYRENGYGLWMVELLSDKTPIAMCGIIKRDSLEEQDIGFALLPGFEGNGYASEVASAVVKYAKDKYNITSLCAITLPNNARSIKLLEKLGMKFRKNILMPGDKDELLLYGN